MRPVAPLADKAGTVGVTGTVSLSPGSPGSPATTTNAISTVAGLNDDGRFVSAQLNASTMAAAAVVEPSESRAAHLFLERCKIWDRIIDATFLRPVSLIAASHGSLADVWDFIEQLVDIQIDAALACKTRLERENSLLRNTIAELRAEASTSSTNRTNRTNTSAASSVGGGSSKCPVVRKTTSQRRGTKQRAWDTLCAEAENHDASVGEDASDADDYDDYADDNESSDGSMGYSSVDVRKATPVWLASRVASPN